MSRCFWSIPAARGRGVVPAKTSWLMHCQGPIPFMRALNSRRISGLFRLRALLLTSSCTALGGTGPFDALLQGVRYGRAG